MEVTTLDTGWEILNASLSSLLTNTTTSPLEGINNSSLSNTTDDILFGNFDTDVLANFTIEPSIINSKITQSTWYNTKCGKLYQFMFRGFILACIIAFGVIGNVLSILVMRHDIHTSATSLLFFVLAIVDIVVLATRAFVVCIPEWLDYWEITGQTYRRFHNVYIRAYGLAFGFLAQHLTTGMTVFVTVHRYMVVCRPTTAGKLANIKAVRIQLVVLMVAIMIYNLPLFFEFTVKEVFRRGMWIQKRGHTEMAETIAFSIIYKIVMLYIMIYVIPVTFLSVLSYKLVVTVKKAAEKMKKMSNRSQDKQDMTKTLVSIIIVFMICQLPTPTNILIREFTDKQNRRCPYLYFYFRDFDDIGIAFNSAFNFVLYCLFGKRFRRHLKSILCGHKLRIEPMGATLEMSQSTRQDMSAENSHLSTTTSVTSVSGTVGGTTKGQVKALDGIRNGKGKEASANGLSSGKDNGNKNVTGVTHK